MLTVIPKCSRVRLSNVASLGKSVKRSGFHSSLLLVCDPRVFSSTTQEPLSMDQMSASGTSCAAQTLLEIYLSNIKCTRPRLSGIDIVKLESESLAIFVDEKLWFITNKRDITLNSDSPQPFVEYQSLAG